MNVCVGDTVAQVITGTIRPSKTRRTRPNKKQQQHRKSTTHPLENVPLGKIYFAVNSAAEGHDRPVLSITIKICHTCDFENDYHICHRKKKKTQSSIEEEKKKKRMKMNGIENIAGWAAANEMNPYSHICYISHRIQVNRLMIH